MEKNNFMILLCMLLVISYSQPTKKGLNHLRKLETDVNETILIGFDNYNKTPIDNEKNLNITFNTYFLLKNWNKFRIKDENNKIQFNNIIISSYITYHENEDRAYITGNFTCSKDGDFILCDYYDHDYDDNGEQIRLENPYCIVKYACSYNSSGILVPNKMNLTTDFTKDIFLNDTKVSYVTTSAEGLKKDITALNYKFRNFDIMKNITFVSQSPFSFKIKIKDLDDDDESNYIELITKQKNIPCTGKYKKGNPNDGIDDYYLLETKGDNIANYLANTDLKYAIANFTKAKENRILILDFKDGVNSTIKEKKEYKMSSGGLSTGGIVAVAVPTCAVLLGVAGLSFFLSRNNSTPPPQIKTMSNMNMQNNTMGVIANSSEAVIHQ